MANQAHPIATTADVAMSSGSLCVRCVIADDTCTAEQIRPPDPTANVTMWLATGNNDTEPPVTCLMVTRGRMARVTKSIGCFNAQDYQHRELVIVCDGAEPVEAIRRYSESSGAHNVHVIGVAQGKYNLGTLRNISVQEASGRFMCQWDDDDLYHPARIRVQIAAMQKTHSTASCFSDQLQLIENTRSLYWCDWSKSRIRGWSHLIPNTLMWEKAHAVPYPEHGPLSYRGEDSALMSALQRQSNVLGIGGYGYLYIYVTHTENTWSEEHHRRIVTATGLPSKELVARRKTLERALQDYPVSDVLTVRDHTGLALFRYPHSN